MPSVRRFEVWRTPIGAEDLDLLPARARRLAEQRMREMESQGCRAAGYRLQGAGVDHICAVWLTRNHRLVVGFPSAQEVVVLLAGPHDDERAELDVYRTLYDVLGISDYPTGDPLHEQDCCEDAVLPPVDGELVDRFVAGARALRGRRRRELARTRRRR